jgi:thioredoxin reductase (NADPH)
VAADDEGGAGSSGGSGGERDSALHGNGGNRNAVGSPEGGGGPAAPGMPSRGPKPAIIAVDDDPQVLAAVARDLRRQYGERYRILRAPDGQQALTAVEELTLAGDPLALVVADQRMPGMAGIELLTRARALQPEARMVLLTAYADTDAAIAAINEVRLDYYVLKPWDPPEERLYPVLDEVLDEWEASFHPPFEGVKLLGYRWSPDAHRVRDFLARNLVPFRWLDVDREPEEAARIQAAAKTDDLPLVVLPDGSHLVAPSNRELGEAIGLSRASETTTFDLLVIGAGPAGLAAAVYGASEGLGTAVLERVAPGGQAGASSRIENYLGFPAGVSGAELARRALDQAKRLGAQILSPATVVKLTSQDTYRLVELDDGTILAATALIVASGVSYRTLEVDGADALLGSGVFYGASMHDARAYEGEDVVIVGGANSAGQAALHFARFARRVTLLVRASSLGTRMSAYLVEQVENAPIIDVRLNAQVHALHGRDHLSHVDISADGTDERLEASGMFVFIGATPCTDWLDDAVVRDEDGFVLVGPDLVQGRQWKEPREPLSLETSLPGVFAAGDVRAHSIKRVASAVGDGSIAVHLVHQYLGF